MFISEFTIRLKDTAEVEINEKYIDLAGKSTLNASHFANGEKIHKPNACIYFYLPTYHNNKSVQTILWELCKPQGFIKLV